MTLRYMPILDRRLLRLPQIDMVTLAKIGLVFPLAHPLTFTSGKPIPRKLESEPTGPVESTRGPFLDLEAAIRSES